MPQQQRHEAKDLSTIPWKTLAGNILGVTGAHALGYASAGALANVYAKSKYGRKFRRLPKARQRQIMERLVTLAGSGAATTASLASYAGKVRTAEEQARLQELKRLQGMKMRGNAKVASVADAYLHAMKRM